MKKVAIIMGSDSDLPVVSKAFSKLDEYGVPYEVHVFSAHRTPEETKAFTENAADNGFGVIIACLLYTSLGLRFSCGFRLIIIFIKGVHIFLKCG